MQHWEVLPKVLLNSRLLMECIRQTSTNEHEQVVTRGQDFVQFVSQMQMCVHKNHTGGKKKPPAPWGSLNF